MRRLAWLTLGLLMLLSTSVGAAIAEPQLEALAALPAGQAAYGLAVSDEDTVYVSEVGGGRVGTILVYKTSGELLERKRVSAGPSGLVSLRGVALDRQGNLFVADAADGEPERGRILKFSAEGRQKVFASGLTAPGALAFDDSGVLYVTDGRNGAVHWIGPDGTSAPFIEDERLQPHARGGLGASGLAFAPDGRALYVSNTADDLVLKVTIHADGSAGRVSTFVDRADFREDGRPGLLDGPEGLATDRRGNLLVASSRSDAVELFSPQGRLVGRLTADHRPGFAFPTSLAVQERSVYVAHLASDSGRSRLSRFLLADLD